MSSTPEPIDKNLTPIKFHLFKIKFTPYSNTTMTSGGILGEIMKYLTKQRQEGKGFLIDKHQTRVKEVARPLFAAGTIFMGHEKRYQGSIALLRNGKIPMLKPADKFMLVPFDTSIGEIAEQTHYFVDYSTDSVILCVEFNYNGPRASDIEYYFRIVARDKLKLAKATELELIMDVSIDKALADLKNVLNFEVKVQPEKLSQLDTALVGQYLTGITTLHSQIKPKYIKLEALFQSPGKHVVSTELNKGANTMATRFLNALKAKPTNIDVFEHFAIRYEDKDGREEVFNLVKGKKEFEKLVNLKTIKGRAWYELIEDDLNEYIKSL